MSLTNQIRRFGNAIRQHFSHKNCYLCLQTSQEFICKYCNQAIFLPHQDITLQISKNMHQVSANLLYQSEIVEALLPPAYSALYAFSDYKWPVSKLISDLKFAQQIMCAQQLIDWLRANSHPLVFADIDAIIPIPLSFSRYVKRQYNQAHELALCLAKDLQLRVLPALSRVKTTKAQAQLDKFSRIDNVESAFKANTINGCQHVLIVDDVLTTGATINSACKALLSKNPELRISVLVMAIALQEEDTRV